MAAGICNLNIEQGATYTRTILLTNPKPTAVCTTTSAGFAVGVKTISVAVGGTGEIAAGNYVSFGTSTKQYEVTTGIADLSLGGSRVIATGLETAIPAAITTINTYTATNLTGYIVRAQIRQYPKSTTIAASFTCTINANPLLGSFIIELTASQTAAIYVNGSAYNTYGTFNWDLEIEHISTGKVTRLLNGTVNVSPEVTK